MAQHSKSFCAAFFKKRPLLMQPCSNQIVWLNGALVAAEAARIDPADRGLLLGDGLFETLRVAAGTPRHAARHLARLQAGALLLRLDVPDANILHDALAAVVSAHGLAEGVLRLTVTRGPGPRGVLPVRPQCPTVLVTAAPPPPPAAPADVIIARGITRDENSPLSRIKSLNYLPSILARIEAEERGATEALLLNQAGLLAELSAATVLLRRDGVWLTPRLEDGALPGIRRAALLEAGLVREAALPVAWCFEAEALCLGNALTFAPCVRSMAERSEAEQKFLRNSRQRTKHSASTERWHCEAKGRLRLVNKKLGSGSVEFLLPTRLRSFSASHVNVRSQAAVLRTRYIMRQSIYASKFPSLYVTNPWHLVSPLLSITSEVRNGGARNNKCQEDKATPREYSGKLGNRTCKGYDPTWWRLQN